MWTVSGACMMEGKSWGANNKLQGIFVSGELVSVDGPPNVTREGSVLVTWRANGRQLERVSEQGCRSCVCIAILTHGASMLPLEGSRRHQTMSRVRSHRWA